MAERKIIRGHVIIDYWVCCGRCGDHTALAEIRRYGSTRKNAEAEGWRYTKADGWVCPTCLAKKDDRR
jgi:hypothetical protein